MNDKNTETDVSTSSKPSARQRVANAISPSSENEPKPKTKFGQKARTALQVVGAVALVGTAAAWVANKKSVKVEATLPDVDITSTDN